ncbi:Carnosine synthase 1 [Perkinsus olseni]|uniref:Carnosine synthase 1 n=1 Tax=Perkinsus olseni TaxID=32597 RepID=A0A7J6SDC3_PEROL|nr:Carnosine synthase 1 [Perkinsus olseni]
MTSEERSRDAAGPTPTAAFQMLKQIPRELLEQHSEEGQEVYLPGLRMKAGRLERVANARTDSTVSEAIHAVAAIGVFGVFHVEGKFTSRGPRLIEVNARMAGGLFRTIFRLVCGVDLAVEQLLMTVGIPSRPPMLSTGISAAFASVGAPKSGVVDSIEFLDKFRDTSGVVQLSAYVNDGVAVVGPEDGMPSWIAELVVSFSDGHKANALAQKLSAEITADCSYRT